MLNPIPRPKTRTPSSFTEASVSLSTPRRELNAASAHSLFTLSKIKHPRAHDPWANFLFPIDRTCPARALSRCKRTAVALCDERCFAAFAQCSRGASAPLPHVDMNATPRRSVGGGGDRNRTDDLLLAKQALSQLSYTPSVLSGESRSKSRSGVSNRGSRSRRTDRSPLLHGCRSRGASAPLPRPAISAPPKRVVGQGGFEPPTSRLSSARSNQLSY